MLSCRRLSATPLDSGKPTEADGGKPGPEASGKTATGSSDEPFADDGDIPPEVADLFDSLRGEALRRLDEFDPIHLFSLCWAYSTARLLDQELQQQITEAAFRLGRARDARGHGSGGSRPSAARSPRAAARDDSEASPDARDEPEAALQEGQQVRPALEEPSVLGEGPHWFALYKPPHWQVNVDSKEAAKAAAAAPFEDDEDGDAEDEVFVSGEHRRSKAKVHTWLRGSFASYPITADPIEAHGLLHRLDAQTSGILLCAKTYVGAYWLRLQWCSYMVDKEYICLVHGWVDRSVRDIHKRIRVDKKKAPNSRRTVSTHCVVGPNGKPSYTELVTLAHLTKPKAEHETQDATAAEQERYSLVALKLHTGRTHQIRVHMLSIGHPLVSDNKYAEEHFAADNTWCPRNFLHTYRLSFDEVPHEAADAEGAAESGATTVAQEPQASDIVDIRCPLPADLRTALGLLQPVTAMDMSAPDDADTEWSDSSKRLHAEWLSGDRSKLCCFEEYAPKEDDGRDRSAAAPA